MRDTQTIANRLAKRHETRDPIQISKELGYIIVDTQLCDIRGFYQRIQRNSIIYLDSKLSNMDRQWVCAHELGHSLLHKGYNRVFMDTRTHMVTSRYEKEADRFAIELLYSDDYLMEFAGCSCDTIANCLGVTYELAQYRMGTIKRSSLSANEFVD